MFQRERLLKLADFLETKVKPDYFNFRYLVDVIDPDFGAFLTPLEAQTRGSCGTTACAMGWLPAVFPDEWRWVKDFDRLELVSGDGIVWGFDTVAEFFGITIDDAQYLFLPGIINGLCPLNGRASAKEVALHIRQFVARREVIASPGGS